MLRPLNRLISDNLAELAQPMTPLQHTASTLIQASLSPVFLLTAVAATLSVIDTRQNRIVDRARMLERICGRGRGKAEARRQIAFYVERAPDRLGAAATRRDVRGAPVVSLDAR